MEIQNVTIVKLKAAPYNPRSISQHEFESLQRSIDEFGFVEPVVVNKRNMTIVGGHMRVQAAKALGLNEVPVVYVELDDGREKALNVALNKISGEFDTDQLAELLHTLSDEDFDLTGFTTDELESLQDGFVDHDNDGPVDKPDKVKRWTIEELKKERDVFNATGRMENGFVDWLERR